MTMVDSTMVAGGIVLLLAVAVTIDLHRVEVGSITIYTTPALRDLLEKGLFPLWEESGELRAEPVYVAAGEEYNRLRMSGDKPEADLFIHASPLFLAKGEDEGYFLPFAPPLANELNESFHGPLDADGRSGWFAFGWSPLVEVFHEDRTETPDLATAELKYGLAHPTLSNNGIYTALLFEKTNPGAGSHARNHTVVQPVNARANILGVADGSFDVTLGYEAVARFFQAQGAQIRFTAPRIDGQEVSTAVLFCVSLVKDARHAAEAEQFLNTLFTNETQALLSTYHIRSVYDGVPFPAEVPTENLVSVDWEDWHGIERILPRYEVLPNYD